ncbi:hypothetical protein BKP35_00465 [Anaerobacillus arseniciselenatis]|uniref:DUF4190 domain-containing protein n=1 Tax=Anaerobacillus arseniciselenatis TaxID=85682 RepID=A0A1S2LTP7_9BACI|nr:DUF4190 domain-containing protein [Anaerobacillus arseniciselenatis]OIJ15503.1 hypothetical protein BKP35_00465 [Anaerobacillus arseniciselenatis]
MAEQRQTNRLAIIALTLGILAIFLPLMGLPLGLIGIILALIAKKDIETKNQAGRGFAVAGLICSSAGILIQLIIVIISFLSFFTAPVG